jgi:hypothetical protein
VTGQTTDQVVEVPVQITVPAQIAHQIKVMDFDKAIADAKSQVATLEAQRAKFIYDSNLQMVQQQYQKPAENPTLTN